MYKYITRTENQIVMKTVNREILTDLNIGKLRKWPENNSGRFSPAAIIRTFVWWRETLPFLLNC